LEHRVLSNSGREDRRENPSHYRRLRTFVNDALGLPSTISPSVQGESHRRVPTVKRKRSARGRVRLRDGFGRIPEEGAKHAGRKARALRWTAPVSWTPDPFRGKRSSRCPAGRTRRATAGPTTASARSRQAWSQVVGTRGGSCSGGRGTGRPWA